MAQRRFAEVASSFEKLVLTDGAQACHVESIQELMELAVSSPLNPQQRAALLQAIKDDASELSQLGINADNFPDLVNRNPLIATELLIAQPSSPEIDLLLTALSEMDVSVHSLEVINRVASKLTLPREYIQRCISNSMKSCQNSPDKGMQPRLVRLVCVAIQAWVRNKIIDITGTNIMVEIQSFCLEFNKVRETNALYRLIKSIETNAAVAGSPAEGLS